MASTAELDLSPEASLLSPDEPVAFEVVEGSGRSPFLITCDHAGRRLPRLLGTLGLPEAELTRHIAWDLGAAQVTRHLAQELGAFAILQTYSRLVIDCNRHPGVPSSIPTVSESTTIPGNEALPEAAASASLSVAAALLGAGANPSATDEEGVSALRLAVRAGKNADRAAQSFQCVEVRCYLRRLDFDFAEVLLRGRRSRRAGRRRRSR